MRYPGITPIKHDRHCYTATRATPRAPLCRRHTTTPAAPSPAAATTTPATSAAASALLEVYPQGAAPEPLSVEGFDGERGILRRVHAHLRHPPRLAVRASQHLRGSDGAGARRALDLSDEVEVAHLEGQVVEEEALGEERASALPAVRRTRWLCDPVRLASGGAAEAACVHGHEPSAPLAEPEPGVVAGALGGGDVLCQLHARQVRTLCRRGAHARG